MFGIINYVRPDRNGIILPNQHNLGLINTIITTVTNSNTLFLSFIYVYNSLVSLYSEVRIIFVPS